MKITSSVSSRRVRRFSGFVRQYFQSVLIVSLLVAVLPRARAAIPFAAYNDPLFKKGYLNVIHYAVVANDQSKAASNVVNINQAIKDAYNLNNDLSVYDDDDNWVARVEGSLVLYFPLGTYWINGTLKAYTATGTPVRDDNQQTENGINHSTPRNHLAMVGQTTSTEGVRPLIKLIPNAPGFENPKTMLEFKNFGAIYRAATGRLALGSFVKLADETYAKNGNAAIEELVEDPSRAYHQMLRGINLDCNTGNPGAIALQFNQGQESSVENVKITVNSGDIGIRGLPGRGWGAVNIEVIGGRLGLDLLSYPNPAQSVDIPSTGNVGSVVVGAKLTGQKETAVAFNGFVPLSLIGCEIDHPGSGVGVSDYALKIQPGAKVHNSLVNLIDTKITLHNENHTAIDNTEGKCFYARNVYVAGSKRLIRRPAPEGTYIAGGTAQWSRIDEYSYTDVRTIQVKGQGSDIDQSAIKYINSDEDWTVQTAARTDNAGAPPGDLRTLHVWGGLPSVNDADAYDVTSGGGITIVNGVATASSGTLTNRLQAIIDVHPKVFLPKGIYPLTGKLTLRNNTVLFGAARFLTRIEVKDTWRNQVIGGLQQETVMIDTYNNAAATTYLGDLTIGVDTSDGEIAGDWFTALNWRAGRNSMVHIGQIYRAPALDNNHPTNDHSVLKVTGNGGGRWYFAGARKSGHGGHPGFRILEVRRDLPGGNNDEPLWFYGLNLEHPVGPVSYAEFANASNIRIYGVKSEYSSSTVSSVLRFQNVKNAAVFGMGAMRHGLEDRKGSIDFFNCVNVMATLIAPQMDRLSTTSATTGSRTLREVDSGVSGGVDYPHVVSLYKYQDAVLQDNKMTHGENINY